MLSCSVDACFPDFRLEKIFVRSASLIFDDALFRALLFALLLFLLEGSLPEALVPGALLFEALAFAGLLFDPLAFESVGFCAASFALEVPALCLFCSLGSGALFCARALASFLLFLSCADALLRFPGVRAPGSPPRLADALLSDLFPCACCSSDRGLCARSAPFGWSLLCSCACCGSGLDC